MAAPEYSRKYFAMVALGMTVALAIGAVLAVKFYKGNDEPMGDARSTPTTTQVYLDPNTGEPVGGARPSSIVRPEDGKAPVDSSEPGGAEQLALFGVLTASMVFIGVMVFVGGRKARANKAAWRAAAEPGQEQARAAEMEAIRERERKLQDA